MIGASIDTLFRRMRYRGGRKARAAARRLRRGVVFVHPFCGSIRIRVRKILVAPR